MPPLKRRKLQTETEAPEDMGYEAPVAEEPQPQQGDREEIAIETPTAEPSGQNDAATDKTSERQERFKALQARMVSNSELLSPAKFVLTYYLEKLFPAEPQGSSRRSTATSY